MIFGGTDYKKFAKKGLTEKDVFWSKQSANEMYWAVDSTGANFGKHSIAQKPQQLILDNGMSFAMAPESSFVALVTALFKNHGIACMEMQPVWGCMCDHKKYETLPDLTFNFVGMDKSKTKQMHMNKEAYMMYKEKEGEEMCFLLISPWVFGGMGAKSADEEYWVLGAQFL